MKRIILIFMVTLTLFFMTFTSSAVDDVDTELEELADLLDEELLSADEFIEPMESICYDPLMNYMNNDAEYIEEPVDENLEDGDNYPISPYIIADPTEDDDMNLSLTGLSAVQLSNQSDGTYFKNLVTVENETNVSHLHSLISQKYPGCYNIRIHSQGACSDGIYLYNALTVQYAYNGTWNKENCIVSGVYDENDNFITTSIRFTSDMVATNCLVQKDDLKHINGMTYNSLRDELVIACAENGYHNEVYTLDADYFRDETDNLPCAKKYELSCMITSIAYNERRNKYVAMLRSTDMYFIIFDSDFNLVGGFNAINTMTEIEEGTQVVLAHQDICCDDNYIYATYYKDYENFLVILDWKGDKITEINLNLQSVYDSENNLTSKYEIEGISILNDRIVLNFNVFWRNYDNEKDKTTFIYLYDLSDECFNIKYCPDDNVANYVNNNNLRNNTVIYGISTPLLINTHMNNGYKFKGWNLYNPETNKWRYENKALKKTGWYVEGAQPEGYVKIVYAIDGKQTLVKQTVPAGMNLLLCATWEQTDKFYVSYSPNDNGSGTIVGSMVEQEMTYGQVNYLNEGDYTKTVNGNPVTFLGWNPYSPEVNKWYYESADKSQRGWYTEGEEPTGFTKVIYTDGGYVRKTTIPGGHIILFALWKEFTIYYDAGGKLINSTNILFPTIIQKGTLKDLQKYTSTSVSDLETDIPTGFNGYYQYHVESERWRYYSDTDSSIWLTNSTLPLFTFTGKAVGDGIYAGQHVVFKANWSYT